MRKTLLAVCMVLLSLVLVYGYADASVSGACVDCHTMHNSEGGATVAPAGTPAGLLRNSCLGCHTSTTGSDPLADDKPRVVSTSDAFNNDNSLAGGYFGSIRSATDNHSSNQHDVGVANINLPAGYSGSWYTGGTSADGLTCAGTNGCHGDETLGVEDDMQAIRGGHHNPTAYRMLFVDGSTVTGTGASDYEKALIVSPSALDEHNIYNATVGGPSISELCGKCHSSFHSDTGSSGAWIRHPTDVVIPTDWEIYSSFTDEWTNDPEAWKEHPLGFAGSQSAANARVICVSCHRAHGTEYSDNLRWDYTSEMLAGQAPGSEVTYGCLGCHNKQR